ncbi:NAD(P)H-dependent glycerol-3-phosphate dehydrogenase [Afipia birgiae]|jgi:glycerol-3-phosphate dehydrogenase (NAD(P)+)|uniref:NAD(P)H-dependent glycerol-3-phosphate dehydrogenase n=1 Tax=Afipia birgiae TaxID=151414 RepID=UPI00031A0560|nr:NAD(P)H-dependent glycerol-3-phosphate dehydrogenase [Afipia birgiae]MBX9823138.1 NAD(P)-dependent glycerol-3-phosphate dehydrogenase [Afipia birgiae]
MIAHQTISVVGAGAWGTALANAAARAGRDVVLYARDSAVAEKISQTRENPKLPGIQLAKAVSVTSDLARAGQANAVLLVTPAQSLRQAATALAPHLAAGTPVIVCAKGIERGTHQFMTQIVTEVAPDAAPAILSGPSFDVDVARGLPTAVTLATTDEALAKALVQALGSATFRPYHSTDVRGVEIGGAAKNVLAIAAGIVAGRKLGASALAALTTRGFAELMRLGLACGAKSETIAGLSGLGDLLLSCSSPQSRNFSHGIALGKGEAPARGKLVEGEFTAPVLIELAAEKNIEMPVANAVAAILSGALTIDEAIETLLTRPFRAEG